MPRVSNFVSIQDHARTIPDAEGRNDIEFPPFDALGAFRGPAILAFRLQTIGNVRLQAALNGSNLFVKQFQTEPERSWHEVISTPDLVKPTENYLTIAVNGGKVIVSDVVLFYSVQVA